jgi:hypothetical protein
MIFLASWIENAGAAGKFPLHLACIGNPPNEVRMLAERAGARISHHDPIRIRSDHHVGNKLRGLEVDRSTNNVLLLDVDVMVLSDPSVLASEVDYVAVALEDTPKISNARWNKIHRELALPPTLQRIPSLHAELDLPRYPYRWQGRGVPRADILSMTPYYNGGVVFAPWNCRLRELWERNIRRVAAVFPEGPRRIRSIHHSDQAGLAVSLRMLEAEGWNVRRLDDRFNTRWRCLYGSELGVEDYVFCHLTTFLHAYSKPLTTADAYVEAIRHYFEHRILKKARRLRLGDQLRCRFADAERRYERSKCRCSQLQMRLTALCRKYIAPVLAGTDQTELRSLPEQNAA